MVSKLIQLFLFCVIWCSKHLFHLYFLRWKSFWYFMDSGFYWVLCSISVECSLIVTSTWRLAAVSIYYIFLWTYANSSPPPKLRYMPKESQSSTACLVDLVHRSRRGGGMDRCHSLQHCCHYSTSVVIYTFHDLLLDQLVFQLYILAHLTLTVIYIRFCHIAFWLRLY